MAQILLSREVEQGGMECGVVISPGSPAWPAPEGAKTNWVARVWGWDHPAGLEQKNGNNMAPQYLLVTKHKNLSAKVVVVGISAWLPGAS